MGQVTYMRLETIFRVWYGGPSRHFGLCLQCQWPYRLDDNLHRGVGYPVRRHGDIARTGQPGGDSAR